MFNLSSLAHFMSVNEGNIVPGFSDDEIRLPKDMLLQKLKAFNLKPAKLEYIHHSHYHREQTAIYAVIGSNILATQPKIVNSVVLGNYSNLHDRYMSVGHYESLPSFIDFSDHNYYSVIEQSDNSITWTNSVTSRDLWRLNYVARLTLNYVTEPTSCGYCGTYVNADEISDNHGICEVCAENTHYCEECDTRTNNAHTVESRRHVTIHVCNDCRHEHYVHCSDCGDTVHMDNYSGHHDCCDSCADNYYTCEDCDASVHSDEINHYEDEDNNEFCLCNSCMNDRESQRYPYYIRRYNDDYDVDFYRHSSDDLFTKRFYGIELEADRGGKDKQVINSLGEIMGDYAIFKSDGSIDDGFETVSMPCTLNTHLYDVPWGTYLRALIENGYRSHDTSTCGLHIHVSRSVFGDTDEDRAKYIGRLLWIVESFEDELFRFSRRTRESFRRWTRGFNDGDDKKASNVPRLYKKARNKNQFGSRYHVVNLQNRDTIEIRMFKGTLLYKSFISALLLFDHMVNIALDDKINVYRLDWDKFKSLIPNAEHYNYLKSYMAERGI